MVKNKKMIYIILIVALFVTGAVFSLRKKQTDNYVFNESMFCPEFGDCNDYGLESRQCNQIGDCLASCSYGCVSRKWIKGRNDCAAEWPNFECECINGICQRK